MHISIALCILAVQVTANFGPGTPASISNFKNRIKNVVVLIMENRSFDNLLGGQTQWGLDNPIHNGPFCNPLNLTKPQQGQVCTAALDYDEILNDPDHAIHGNNIEFYGTFTPDNKAIADGTLRPHMKGFAHEQLRSYGSKQDHHTLAQQVMNYYTEWQVPVITALVQNFMTFNRWFSDIPGPTNPNRASLLSGTSQGHGQNDDGLTAKGHALTQRSIFQQLTETNRTWLGFYTDSAIQDPLYFDWTYTSGNTDKVIPFDRFYDIAAAGNLPDFTYLMPSCCGVGTNSMHPTGLISDGETLLKDVYDALRSSPQWDETLFILTFDETGGFHDHVTPPLAVRPDNLTYTETTPSGENYTFYFNRLGGRMPTFLISPWVRQGVEQDGRNHDVEDVAYSSSSVLRTLGYLWDFQPFTPRVEKAPSFDHLIGHSKRWTPKQMPKPYGF